MNYPLHLRFKLLALGNTVSITDQTGALLMYMKQKIFKLREEVNIFADEAQTQHKYIIRADRIIDFSPQYLLTDASQTPLGSLKRHGVKSLWSAQYDLTTPQGGAMTITEENPWIKVLDRLIAEIPFIGMVSAYVLHPTYLVKAADGKVVMRLKKQAAFFEGYFTIEKLDTTLTGQMETSVLLSVLMVTLLESRRG